MINLCRGIIVLFLFTFLTGCAEVRDLQALSREMSGTKKTGNCGCLSQYGNGRKYLSKCSNKSSETTCSTSCRNYKGYIYKENGFCKY